MLAVCVGIINSLLENQLCFKLVFSDSMCNYYFRVTAIGVARKYVWQGPPQANPGHLDAYQCPFYLKLALIATLPLYVNGNQS